MTLKQRLFGEGEPVVTFVVTCALLLGASICGIFARLTASYFIRPEPFYLARAGLGFALLALLLFGLMWEKRFGFWRSLIVGCAASFFYWSFQIELFTVGTVNVPPLVGMAIVFLSLCRLSPRQLWKTLNGSKKIA